MIQRADDSNNVSWWYSNPTQRPIIVNDSFRVLDDGPIRVQLWTRKPQPALTKRRPRVEAHPAECDCPRCDVARAVMDAVDQLDPLAHETHDDLSIPEEV